MLKNNHIYSHRNITFPSLCKDIKLEENIKIVGI